MLGVHCKAVPRLPDGEHNTMLLSTNTRVFHLPTGAGKVRVEVMKPVQTWTEGVTHEASAESGLWVRVERCGECTSEI